MKSLVSIFVTFMVFFVVSCKKPPPQFSDSGTKLDRSPLSASYVVKGNKLVITPMDQMGVWLVDARPQVIGGNIYLAPVNISSVGPKSVTVDLSALKLPDDWRQRLYWIQNTESSPFSTTRTDKIYRKRIPLD